VARAGGVIFCPGGKKELSYFWNIGHATNNQFEAYALLQGLQLAKARGIHSIIIVGNPKSTINYAD
jgi:ribonuclease HI